MVHPDDALKELDAIIAEFSAFCTDHGTVSETDTRVKVIDRVLKDVCGWPEPDLSREDHTESGFSDYALKIRNRISLVVEAKREGVAFRLPNKHTNKTYSLSGVIVTEPDVKAAIEQVQRYCVEHGARYAIATNGYAWIVFRAVRDDIPWRKGTAWVFPSLQSIRDNLADFLQLLSHESILKGSLQEEFSQSIRTSRELRRVVGQLFNADLPLQRNRLNKDLEPIVKLVFDDIANQESTDVLRSCYIYSGTLTTVANDLDRVLTETIPKFLVDEGTVPVGHSHSRTGFERVLRDSIIVTKGELFLLLGGIGSGKSTFLRRYQRTVGNQLLEDKTIWFHVDFLKAPLDVLEMELFVWQTVLDDLRTRYREHDFERRKYLHQVFETEILTVHSTLLSDMKPGTYKYNKALSPLLDKWMRDLHTYLPRLLQVSCKRLQRTPVIFIDNVDQLPPEYQAKIFLLAQRVTRMVGCITIVALREESYYTANVKKTFTAYSTRKFHIASPHFRRMIGNRIKYAMRMLESQLKQEGLTTAAKRRLADIRDFLTIVLDAMVENRKIGRFIKAICHGNMRFALEMFVLFVTSGTTDVEKMLRIYNRDGLYNIADHEFVKAVMLRDRCYYKEEHSPIANIFDVGSQKNSSHFTGWRILRILMEHRGESTPEGQGYVELGRLLHQFEDVFNNQDDFVATITRLVTRNLVETNTRASDTVEGASHVRATSAGWYYIRFLAVSFAYLDLVLQDTPFNDGAVEKSLRDSVYDVNNMLDREENKLERVRARFARVERFLQYLEKEEAAERSQFGLDQMTGPLSEPIVPGIKAEFEDERDWIDRRIRQNRERYREEHAGHWDEQEGALMGVADDEPEEDVE